MTYLTDNNRVILCCSHEIVLAFKPTPCSRHAPDMSHHTLCHLPTKCNHHPCVIAAAAKAYSKLPPEAQRDQVLQQYNLYFGNTTALREELFVCKDWTSERFSGGCFAGLMPPGLWTRCGHTLQQPVEGIHWAGSEAAVKWVGYMEGALEAAARAAAEVLTELAAAEGK